MVMTKYYVDTDGTYLGGFDGAEPPDGAIEVTTAPQDARQIWSDGTWGAIPVTVPDRVSANQFGKQLIAAGLMDQVNAWVSEQDAETQWSFNRSATFVRDDPMMQTGFAALGFTSAQIDAFFVAAALL
jgi:hypothetical protein